MLIGFDASRANKTKRSGVEWYSYHLLKQIYKLDDKNGYFLYTPNKLSDDLKPLPQNFQERILIWPFKKFWTQGRLSLELLKKKPDILFVPAHIFPLVLGRKNIITWPDVGHQHFPDCYSKSQLKIIEYGLKRAIKVADRIITISEFSKQELVNYYQIAPSKIVVTYLGYDERVFYPRSPEEISQVKAQYHLKNPYLLYVGRLAKRKNLVNLIEAYEHVRQIYHQEIDLALVGSQDFGYQSILDKIKQTSYQQSIKLLGYVRGNDLPSLMSGAACLVHPSLFEGFGLTILEALACGCPVIASTSGALPEIVDEAGLLVDAHDIKGFANKMVEVVSNQKLRQDLINKGLAYSQKFSWEKCAKETLKVFESMK